MTDLERLAKIRNEAYALLQITLIDLQLAIILGKK